MAPADAKPIGRRTGVPTTVKIIGTRWQIIQRQDLEVLVEDVLSTVYNEGTYHEHEKMGLLGLTDGDLSKIVVNTEQGEDKFRVTLLHEVLHAIVSEAGLRDVLDANREEQVVKRMAPILRQVLKDNPRVYTFLTGRRLW